MGTLPFLAFKNYSAIGTPKFAFKTISPSAFKKHSAFDIPNFAFKTTPNFAFLSNNRYHLLLQHPKHFIASLTFQRYPTGKSAKRGQYGLLFTKGKAGDGDTFAGSA